MRRHLQGAAAAALAMAAFPAAAQVTPPTEAPVRATDGDKVPTIVL